MYTLLTLGLLNQFIHVDCMSSKQPSQNTLHYAINEESEVGSFVGNLKLDAERKLLIPLDDLKHFELYDASKRGYFRVDAESGKLFAAARIDRETICPQQVMRTDELMSAYSEDRAHKSSLTSLEHLYQYTQCVVDLSVSITQKYWINVLVVIHDMNDHQPNFPSGVNDSDKNVYIVRVSESLAAGYEVSLTPAKDADTGLNAVQTYSLRGAELDPAIFRISFRPPYDLKFSINRELDAEAKAEYNGELVACDGGQPIPKCGTVPIQVHVTDINDNKPVFNQSIYEVVISEATPKHSTVIRVSATDADSGLLGQVSYRFGQPISQSVFDHFTLISGTGEVKIKKSLNAKVNSKFVIPILAEDGGDVPLTGQTIVRVTVTDVNDHAPWIEVRPVHVDNDLIGDQKEMLLVEENKPPGTHLGLIIVGDDDVGENGTVDCLLRAGQTQLRMEHANSAKGQEIYQLSSAVSFDRESITDGKLSATIVCTDNGRPPQTSQKSITLHVQDTNEFAPVFTYKEGGMDIKVEEGQQPGIFLFQSLAADSDAIPSVSYHLSSEAHAYFRINASSGVVTTHVVLDREETPIIKFSIYASDGEALKPDNRTATLNVTVMVTDINDNAPELSVGKLMRIVENRPGFSEMVGQLTSFDKDSGNNGTVRYKLLSVTSSGILLQNDTFIVDSETGKVFTLHSLDREQYNQYMLQVSLYDLGTPESKNTTEQIIVEVLDENDNSPIWEPLLPLLPEIEYHPLQQQLIHRPNLNGLKNLHELGLMNISGQLYGGQRLAKLIATDKDETHNANLTYHLANAYLTTSSSTRQGARVANDVVTSNDFFSVSPFTGELSVGAAFLNPDVPTLVEVYLRVSDNGNLPLETVARLFIHLFTSSITTEQDGANKWGLLFHLLSTGNLGILATLALVFIICATFICLVIAFSTVRRKSTKSCCSCRSSKVEKVDNIPQGLTQLLNSQLGAEEEFALDGQLSALGTLYNASKTDSLCSDIASNYGWMHGKNAYKSGGCVDPPVPRFAIYNGATVGMKYNQRGDDQISLALLPFDVACSRSGKELHKERGLYHQHVTIPPIYSAMKHNFQENGPIESTGTVQSKQDLPGYCLSSEKNELDYKHCSPTQAVTNEIDRGSADSGQGASEDEPTTFEWYKLPLTSRKPQGSAQQPFQKSRLLGSSLTAPHQRATSNMGTTQSAPSQSYSRGKRMTVTTFIHMNKTVGSTGNEADRHQPVPNGRMLESPSPTSLSKWLPPLFLGGEIGHHNQLFESSSVEPMTMYPKQQASLTAINKQADYQSAPQGNQLVLREMHSHKAGKAVDDERM